jgi:hypothetical protein
MRKLFAIFAAFCMLGASHAAPVARDAAPRRAAPDTTARTAAPVSVRSARPQVSVRSSQPVRATAPILTPRAAPRTARSAVSARATTTPVAETRTGATYDVCKSAYFACMDQFCAVKNTSYQRCSCSDRIYDITAAQSVMEDAGAQLTTFTESLDAVGLTAAQAAAMRKASEGELALTGDKSSSAALLQAIMNSIKGENASVGGAYEGLNSINIRMSDSSGFGFIDSGQEIAEYNGKNLYSAIYGKCREAVRDDCTDATLQRSVTAYLMAVEQDCNSVQKQLDDTKKKMAAAVRETSAMLDLARVKDRQERNSSDATTCLREVEKVVQSEEVCGSGYRKCLDNGKYIDVATGKPMAGVVEFYKLQELLSFSNDISVADQKLAKIPANRSFVSAFDAKVRQFAQPALDKCQEISSQVWSDYLDKAMLEIYYAQRQKVDEIKTGCMDFVSACYMDGNQTITAAMSGLVNSSTGLVPGTIELLDANCKNYVSACDKMFDGNIVAQYIENRKTQDLKDSCRAVVRQCFDSFGGTAYSNFYNPISGIFSTGRALDWFSFDSYDYSSQNTGSVSIVSACARRLMDVAACNPADNPDFAREIFGGFDRSRLFDGEVYYGLRVPDSAPYADTGYIDTAQMHKIGVATEIYNQIMNSLSVDCQNYDGRFVQKRFLNLPQNYYHYQLGTELGLCISGFSTNPVISNIVSIYNVMTDGENVCPMNYWRKVDTVSWGICSCWENGARRSNNGISLKCVPGRYRYGAIAPVGGIACSDSDNSCDRGILNIAAGGNVGKICPWGVDASGAMCQNPNPVNAGMTITIEDINLLPNAQ